MAIADCDRAINHIVNWLQDYLLAVPSLKGYIVGVSGGIDSAVVAHLCARTSQTVFLVNMPIKQDSEEYFRAKKQISSLTSQFNNVSGIDLPLDRVYDVFKDSLPDKAKGDSLVLANSRSRLRMLYLYAIGQANNLLVAGTGNKIEDHGIGFFTKYGDGGVDVQPIGDLLKSEVFQLGAHLGVIPEILNAEPTDGLWDDKRTDEKQIGATYEELEAVMEKDINSLSGRALEVKKIFERLHHINKHKMIPIPVCAMDKFKE